MFPTIATPFNPDHPAPLFVCPQCGSANVRMAAVIAVVLRPNDQPFVDGDSFIGMDCDWDDDADAWCNKCEWNGTAAELVAQPHAESTDSEESAS
jgi:hypothetical protein